MRMGKVKDFADRGKSVAGYDHYLALEWSLAKMVLARQSKRGGQPRLYEGSSDIREIKEVLKKIGGTKILTVEESGSAHWLYLELTDYVDRILVCNPHHNRLLSNGPKTDRIDALKLCELLRAGLLKEVYHADNGLYELRNLVSAYVDVVQAGVRAKNQRAAMAIGHRNDGKHAPFIGSVLDENIALYERNKAEYEKRFTKLVRRNMLLRYQDQIHGIGDIGAVKILATVVDARRFATKGRYWSYCGLVKHEKESGGRKYGRRRGRYNRVLKEVYRTATKAALRGNNPIREYYEVLCERGMAEPDALNAVARYIAGVSYGMLKSGKPYEPYRWKHADQEETTKATAM